MRQDFDLTNFTAGELSPRLKGRIDFQKYFNGAASLLNMVVMPQGGITRRPGTEYVNAVFNQAGKPRLRRFLFSTQQAYMLEFGANYVRVYKNDGLLINDQPVTGAASNGAGAIRLTLASAAGLYTGNLMSVTGVLGTVEANGAWSISNVTASQAVLGTANNGSGGVRVQMASTANFINGAPIVLAGVGGTIEANGTWSAQIVDATHIDLQGSAYANAWTSGGAVTGNDAFSVDLIGSVFSHAYAGGGTTTTPVQIPVPYQQGDLDALYFAQSDDLLFITHPNYPAATLGRSSNTLWTYQTLVFRDGPYLDTNATSTTLTISNRGTSRSGGQQIIRVGGLGLTITLNPGTQTRSLTLTASSIFGINATPQSVGQGFLTSDVGRHLRIKLMSTWCWTIIAAVVSPTQVVAIIQPTVNGGAWGGLDGDVWQPDTYFPNNVVVTGLSGGLYQCVQEGISAPSGGPTGSGTGTSTEIQDGVVIWNHITGSVPTSTTFWALGKWSNGVYPYVCSFWQQRLMMLGSALQANAVEASNTGDFTNFAPTQQDGTSTDSNALSWVISDDQVNAIQWVKAAGSAQAAQLAIGTVGEEHIMQAASTVQPITPTNVQVYPETANGSLPIEPLRISKSLLFMDRAGRKLFEWTFLWQVNGYDTIELSQYSEHITVPGVVQMVYAQAPHRLVCLLRSDGTLLFCAYNKTEQVFAPARQVLGGDYYGGPPIVESIDVIPSEDTTYDEIWLSVLRTVNGVPFRSIEVVTRWFENDVVPQENAVFLDCSLSTVLPAPAATITVSGLTNTPTAADAPPLWTGVATIEASAGVFSEASVNSYLRVNGGVILINAAPEANQATGIVVRGLSGLAPAAAGAWTLAPLDSSVSGLSYLVGETVGILGDGADFGTTAVTGNGSVALAAPGATMVTVGLPYTSAAVTMPFEPQRAAAAASSGKAKRIDSLWLRFHESLGCNFGQRLTDSLTDAQRDVTEALLTRSASMVMGQAPALYSGSRKLRPQGGYDQEGQIVVTTSSPLPLTILSIFAKADVGDLPGGR